jgi:hypothetical protein
VNQQIVVTVSAGAPICVVLEQTPKSINLIPDQPRNSHQSSMNAGAFTDI